MSAFVISESALERNALILRDVADAEACADLFSRRYAPEEIAELAEISDHLDFNSLTQWNRFREEVMRHPRFLSGELKCGLRVNESLSTGHAPGPPARPAPAWRHHAGRDAGGRIWPAFPTLHFHTLCEQGADDLAATLGPGEPQPSIPTC